MTKKNKDYQLTLQATELAQAMEEAAKDYLASAGIKKEDTATVTCAAMAITEHEMLLVWPDRKSAMSTADLINDMVKRLQMSTPEEGFGIDN